MFFVLAVSGEKICGAVVIPVALLALELEISLLCFLMSNVLVFLLETCLLFHFGFWFWVESESNCWLHVVKRNTEKNVQMRFPPRPNRTVQAPEKVCSVIFISS